MLSKPTTPPKFPELPVEVQVALVNAAAYLASAQISGMYRCGKSLNEEYPLFEKHFRLICDALYLENRG